MKNKRVINLILCLFFCLNISGQDTDTVVSNITACVHAINNFLKQLPQEQVYLHFDNTSYYQGDQIWFKCYVVQSKLQQKALSQTIYVELLNPGGFIIDKRTLKIENGECHGDFKLDKIPFYSGFYEIRAYTKYMLNFGGDMIFSRVFPVFEQPKKEGDFEEKKISKYNTYKYPVKRKNPKKDKKVNIKFYPEGGNLVEDIESQVAFEATDEYGNPIDISGTIINKTKEEIAQFSSSHEGRGVFKYTPTNEKHEAIVNYNGKKHQFDIPKPLAQGFVINIDNISYADSIEVHLQKSNITPDEMLGLAIINRGAINNFHLISTFNKEKTSFRIDKTKLQTGVSWIVIFNGDGKILCDRYIFTKNDDYLKIKTETKKEKYEPYEKVNLGFIIKDKNENPIQTTFSLAVRDGENEVESGENILTNLLLMSDIKGFIRNPSYYFESNDETHRSALDLLLMVQGWRRHSWKEIAGIKPFELKYRPEKGIEINGKVVSFVKKVPKANVNISSLILRNSENVDVDENVDIDDIPFTNIFVSDSLGRFSFSYDLMGKWNTIMSVSEKGKRKDYRIILDRLYSPEPKKYSYPEMKIDIANNNQTEQIEEISHSDTTNTSETDPIVYTNSSDKTGIDKKTHQLKEVVVKAKKRSKESEIFNNRSKSIAYYDVHSEIDEITDEGEYIGDDIHEFLMKTNQNFSRRNTPHGEYLHYKHKMPLFVVNYERTEATELSYNKYKNVRLSAIKSMYINENLSIMCQYADPRMTFMDVDKMYSCAVFIETYPEGKVPVEGGKGVRKTLLEGYSKVSEFYNPDYSIMSPEPDYRRTLYWNPSVITDKDGKANVLFYNNSRCEKFKISAETITSEGKIGIQDN